MRPGDRVRIDDSNQVWQLMELLPGDRAKIQADSGAWLIAPVRLLQPGPRNTGTHR